MKITKFIKKSLLNGVPYSIIVKECVYKFKCSLEDATIAVDIYKHLV